MRFDIYRFRGGHRRHRLLSTRGHEAFASRREIGPSGANAAATMADRKRILAVCTLRGIDQRTLRRHVDNGNGDLSVIQEARARRSALDRVFRPSMRDIQSACPIFAALSGDYA